MEFLLPYLPIIIPILVILLILLMGYVKAPPDQAYIISGLRKNSRILIGQAGIRIPFLERLDKLYLGQMTVDIKTEQSVPTNDLSTYPWTLWPRCASPQRRTASGWRRKTSEQERQRHRHGFEGLPPGQHAGNHRHPDPGENQHRPIPSPTR